MSYTFMHFELIWITSFVNSEGPLYTDADAKSAYVKINAVTGVANLLTAYFVAKYADRMNPKIITPLAIFIMSIALLSIKTIANPLSFYSFFLWTTFRVMS
jgi:hypothetical protein